MFCARTAAKTSALNINGKLKWKFSLIIGWDIFKIYRYVTHMFIFIEYIPKYSLDLWI